MKACLESRKVMKEEFLVKWGQRRFSFFGAKGIRKMQAYQDQKRLQGVQILPRLVFHFMNYVEIYNSLQDDLRALSP